MNQIEENDLDDAASKRTAVAIGVGWEVAISCTTMCFSSLAEAFRRLFGMIETYKKQAWARGLRADPPFCEPAGEFRRELHYTRACYINKAWHEWYKSESQRLGLAYSKSPLVQTLSD